MNGFIGRISAFVAWLCGLFQVSPDWITRDRRGNLPPASGGPSAT